MNDNRNILSRQHLLRQVSPAFSVRRQRRFALLLTLLLLSLLCSIRPGTAIHAQAPPGKLDSMWLDIGLGPPLVDLFNQVARPDDIARVNSVDQVDLLDGINVGRKLVVFRSVRDVEQALPRLADKFDIIGYNLEHGPTTPAQEQADPVGSIRHLRQLADRYGMEVALGPDHDFALSHGVEMAPYVDIFVLQVQRVQTDPQTVYDFVMPMVEQLRLANPDLESSVQVRTEGDVDAIVDLLVSLQDYLEGISILTSPETVEVAEQLLAALRPDSALAPRAPAPAVVGTNPSGQATASGQWLPDSFADGALVGALAAFGLIALCAFSIVMFALVLALLFVFYYFLIRRQVALTAQRD